MDLWLSTLVAAFLLVSAAGLMGLHLRAWRRAQRLRLPDREHDYRRRQFRRRMQTSAMLAVVALAIFAGPLLSGPPLVVLGFWGVVLLLVLWMVLLAAADALSTRLHFLRLRDDFLIERAKLQAEIRRIQATRGNGKPHEPR